MVHDLHGINLTAVNRFETLKYCVEHSLCWVASFAIDLGVNSFLIEVDSPEPYVNEEKNHERTTVLGAAGLVFFSEHTELVRYKVQTGYASVPGLSLTGFLGIPAFRKVINLQDLSSHIQNHILTFWT